MDPGVGLQPGRAAKTIEGTGGFHATQATISRDIKELRLVKRAADGAYQKPGVPPGGGRGGEEGVRRAVSEYLRRLDQVQQLLVMRTDPGQAQSPGRRDRSGGASRDCGDRGG